MQSAYAKLARARQHVEELRSSIETYRASDAITFRMRTIKDPLDSSVTIVEYVVRVATEPPSQQWGLMVGDVLTNLRAALDHALFGHILARHPGLSEPQQKKIQFPIVIDPKNWSTQHDRYTPWVDPALWSFIHAKQPFHEPDPTSHGLHILNELVNRDKHRTLHVLAYKGAATFDRINDHITELPAAALPLVDGAVLARTRLLRPWRTENSKPQQVVLPGESAYIEHIDAPGFDQSAVGALDLMQNLTDATETFLGELRDQGC